MVLHDCVPPTHPAFPFKYFKESLKGESSPPTPDPSLSGVCVLLLVSSIKCYKSLILEISINGWNSLRSGLHSLLSSSRLEEFPGGEGKGGSYAIICSHKYTKLAAYQLISVHDPAGFFSVHPKLPTSPEPRILAGSTERGWWQKGVEGVLIKSLFKDNKARASPLPELVLLPTDTKLQPFTL